MADESLHDLIEQIADNLSPLTRSKLEDAHRAQHELDARVEARERARRAYDALSKEPPRSGPKDDMADAEQSRSEALAAATAAVDKQRQALAEARRALSESLGESDRAELERLGAAARSSEQPAHAAAVAEGRRLHDENRTAAMDRSLVVRQPKRRGSKRLFALGTAVAIAAVFLAYALTHRPASAAPWTKLAATADCDCPNVRTTSWRKATIDLCKEGERAILNEAREGRFEITVNEAGRMGGLGPFCDSGASGPIAWPMRGGTPVAPASLTSPACHYVGGARQWVCP